MADILSDPDIAIMLTGALVGTATALIGPFLILRQNAMLTDAISHSIVFGIMIVWLLTGLVSGPLQIIGAGLSGVLCVWLTETLAGTGRVKQDAAIGLVFPAMFAAGVLLMNLYARDVHIDVHTVLLGEIGFVWLDTVEVAGVSVPNALLWIGAVTLMNALFVGLFWKELKLATFDPVLAQAFGMAPRALFYALLFLTSATAVAAFDAVGVILFLAFAIVPPSTAYLITDRLERMLAIGIVIAIFSSVAGYAVAVALDVSIGGMMALMTGQCLLGALIFGPRHGVVALIMQRRIDREVRDVRTLMVHLASHEASIERGEENIAEALETHLGWEPARAEGVMQRSLSDGYILRDGARLHLTDKGRSAVTALLQPWRRQDM